MLGWITGQTDDQSRAPGAMDPPETPAPVFAMRAFRSVIFGTPAGEDNDNNERPATMKNSETPLIRKKDAVHPTIEMATIQQQQQEPKEKSSSDATNQLSVSPTKSILVTPGTISNRRKTVSFGDTAVHGDSERDRPQSRSSSFAPSSAGSVTSQWMSSQSDGKSRPRSRLTQSLIDAKELHTEEPPKTIEPARNESFSTKDISNDIANAVVTEDRDETVDLNDPRSQSGQYWKTEFENYRKRTNFEIRRLIEYRAVAKSYARKKDTEAMRLAEKLQKEEEKVAEMERRVAGLASDMMSKDVDADREDLVQKLAKQTALTLQFKHKVENLRKTLEQHGVVGSPDAQTDSEELCKDDRAEIIRLQQALDEANKNLEEKVQDDELEKLRNLAKSSENKVSELEKENALLKKTIARVKGEMGKYEERRSEKETKLKQRAAKYEARCQEYKEKMREYRVSVHEERQMYSQQIQRLKEEVAALSLSNRKLSVNDAQRSLEEKSHAGVQVHDFGDQGLHLPVDNNEEMLQHCLADNRRNRGPGFDGSNILIRLAGSPEKGIHGTSPTENNNTVKLPSSPPMSSEPVVNTHWQHSALSTATARETRTLKRTKAIQPRQKGGGQLEEEKENVRYIVI
ncbi:hypothetical protein UA08_00210 [Talaromyces atroroseus]|uniref:Spindle pole body-associated protein cut12 domain-containing protein n=1 Tax=Talaromyces atroroseus TaxID=1441469 RepID=A0A225BAJ1_TALAT|nr:hypothetical protein UA08_00210 [Talaromyces atroroseus]OKL64406.1 hypothetical protein UA08_00210 [Talaromyces atroroseus]